MWLPLGILSFRTGPGDRVWSPTVSENGKTSPYTEPDSQVTTVYSGFYRDTSHKSFITLQFTQRVPVVWGDLMLRFWKIASWLITKRNISKWYDGEIVGLVDRYWAYMELAELLTFFKITSEEMDSWHLRNTVSRVWQASLFMSYMESMVTGKHRIQHV